MMNHGQKTFPRSLAPLAFLAAATWAGCEGEISPTAPQEPAPQEGAVSAGTLEHSTGEGSLLGHYTDGRGRVDFRVANIDPATFDVVVKVNGAVLTGTVNQVDQVAETDGFVDGSGAETQLREEDRQLLAELHQRLPGIASELGHIQLQTEALEKLMSLWRQTPDTLGLAKSIHGAENRGWTSLCSYCNQFLFATHDCDYCGKNNPYCTSYAQVGSRQNPTETWTNGVWVPGYPYHPREAYQRGECYGNSGPKCPGPIQQLTVDALNHDQCLSNGHAYYSPLCVDDFDDAWDDELFAPNCQQSGERRIAICYGGGGPRGGARTCTCPTGFIWDGGSYCHRYVSTCN